MFGNRDWSSDVCSSDLLALLPIAFATGERLVPATGTGWLILAGLALTSQVAGQSLIAYAMAQLPATFTSVALLFQPVVSAFLAWLLLGEPVTFLQVIGCALVLIGIRVTHIAETGASRALKRDSPRAT
jgi:drug/metabolite transporter (DMT)-like permease